MENSTPSLSISAGRIAQDRFERYLHSVFLKGATDEQVWEFYIYLYEQAEKHSLAPLGFTSPAYEADDDQAWENQLLMAPLCGVPISEVESIRERMTQLKTASIDIIKQHYNTSKGEQYEKYNGAILPEPIEVE